jgi:hypothetical protein
MTEDELRRAYASAFLMQARSDWAVFNLLQESEHPPCHALHYLQMACEKLAKAYRLRDTASPVTELVSHHVGFTKFIRQYLLSPRFRDEYAGKHAKLHSLMQDAAKLAAEVEKLAPAIDRRNAPENAEYPWEAGETVVAPCTWGFPSLSLLREQRGRTFLKLVSSALRDYESTTLA